MSSSREIKNTKIQIQNLFPSGTNACFALHERESELNQPFISHLQSFTTATASITDDAR